MNNEIWKEIAEVNGMYQISNLGKVKATKPRYKNKKLLKTRTNPYGYETVSLYKKTYFIHRLVAIAFIENKNNKPCINHIDGNKFNNTISNLEWCTYAENNQHANDNSLAGGLKHNKSKLTLENILYIRENYKPYDKMYSIESLAKKFNVSTDTILRTVKGKTYTHVPGKISCESNKINEEVRKYIKNNYIPYDKVYGATTLGKKFNISAAWVSKLAKK